MYLFNKVPLDIYWKWHYRNDLLLLLIIIIICLHYTGLAFPSNSQKPYRWECYRSLDQFLKGDLLVSPLLDGLHRIGIQT